LLTSSLLTSGPPPCRATPLLSFCAAPPPAIIESRLPQRIKVNPFFPLPTSSHAFFPQRGLILQNARAFFSFQESQCSSHRFPVTFPTKAKWFFFEDKLFIDGVFPPPLLLALPAFSFDNYLPQTAPFWTRSCLSSEEEVFFLKRIVRISSPPSTSDGRPSSLFLVSLAFSFLQTSQEGAEVAPFFKSLGK